MDRFIFDRGRFGGLGNLDDSAFDDMNYRAVADVNNMLPDNQNFDYSYPVLPESGESTSLDYDVFDYMGVPSVMPGSPLPANVSAMPFTGNTGGAYFGDLLNEIQRGAIMYEQYDAMKELNRINMQRAAQGRAPLSAAQYMPSGAPATSPRPQSDNLMLWIAGGLGVAALVAYAAKR